MSKHTKLPKLAVGYMEQGMGHGHYAVIVAETKELLDVKGPHKDRIEHIVRAVNLFDPFIKLLYHLHNKLQHNKEYADDTRQIENLLHESGHETMPEV